MGSDQNQQWGRVQLLRNSVCLTLTSTPNSGKRTRIPTTPLPPFPSPPTPALIPTATLARGEKTSFYLGIRSADRIYMWGGSCQVVQRCQTRAPISSVPRSGTSQLQP